MTNKVGSSTIYSTILPNNAALNRIKPVKLSRAANFRLQVIEHYLNKTRNVSLTCRHFAIAQLLLQMVPALQPASAGIARKPQPSSS